MEPRVLKKPRYEYWLKLDTWKSDEAILLLHDICPSIFNTGLVGFLVKRMKHPEHLRQSLSDVKNMLENSIYAEKNIASGFSSTLDPSEFIQWADSKGLKIPEALKPLLIQKDTLTGTTGEATPYLDKKYMGGNFFSKELNIAIRAWLEMYGPEGRISTNEELTCKAHRPEIEKYLKKHYPDLKSSERDRIATMINARKAGASRTE